MCNVVMFCFRLYLDISKVCLHESPVEWMSVKHAKQCLLLVLCGQFPGGDTQEYRGATSFKWRFSENNVVKFKCF